MKKQTNHSERNGTTKKYIEHLEKLKGALKEQGLNKHQIAGVVSSVTEGNNIAENLLAAINKLKLKQDRKGEILLKACTTLGIDPQVAFEGRPWVLDMLPVSMGCECRGGTIECAHCAEMRG